jgi:hypothetical protein
MTFMSATRIRYLLNQWRLRSLALSRLEDVAEDIRKSPGKSDGPASQDKPPPEKDPSTPE